MFPRIRKQAGNLYIVAIFVIVVMGFLATALSRMEWSNSDALSKDLLGTRAWLAAHSVNEYLLTKMYPLGDPETNNIVNVCGAMNADQQGYAASLLTEFKGCKTVTTTCNDSTDYVLDSLRFYKIQTAVQCGSGQYLVERQQEVWVKE